MYTSTLFRVLAILYLTSCTVAKKRTNVTAEAKVLILGAGMAGISAAKTLTDSGVNDFIILEGQGRIGGRIKEISLGGYTVSLGATWIQSTRNNSKSYNNPIYDLALKYNVSTVEANYDDWTVRNATGYNVTAQADERYEEFDEANQKLADFSKRYLRGLVPEIYKDDLNTKVSLNKFGWNPKTPLDQVIQFFDMEFESGQEIDKSSSRHSFALSTDYFQDEDLLVNDQGSLGFASIPQGLMDEVLSENDSTKRLYLNRIVTDIEYDEDGVVVTTASGERFAGDQAILTFSIGVLQNRVVNFTPELPEWKTDSIDGFKMSLYGHYFLKFPENESAFWDDTQFILYAGSKRFFNLWQNLDKNALPGSRILHWVQIGEAVEDLAFLTEAQIQAEAMEVLRVMYGPSIPEPEAIVVPRWNSDRFTYGAYSDWPIGYTDSQHKSLRAPIGKLYFAGEAMSYDLYGFAQGAYFSGKETAEAILACIENDVCPKDYVPPYAARGCTYPAAENYARHAQVEDNSCTFIPCTSTTVRSSKASTTTTFIVWINLYILVVG